MVKKLNLNDESSALTYPNLIHSFPVIKNQTSLEKCRQLIEVSLNWGNAADWTNEDFV